MRFSTYAEPTLLRKGGPQFKQVVSYRGTGTVNHNVPSSASVGDYLVIAGMNGLSLAPSPADGWFSIYSPISSGTQYWDSTRMHIKICTQSDIGSSVPLNASDFYFASNFYVFTNPNKMFHDTNPSVSLGQISNFIYDTKNQRTGASTSSVSSITIPDHNFNYGPNYLKIISMGCNPNSSNTDISYNGPGVGTSVEDGFWWRSLRTVYQTPATITNGTFFANGGGGSGMSWTYIYLI